MEEYPSTLVEFLVTTQRPVNRYSDQGYIIYGSLSLVLDTEIPINHWEW